MERRHELILPILRWLSDQPDLVAELPETLPTFQDVGSRRRSDAVAFLSLLGLPDVVEES